MWAESTAKGGVKERQISSIYTLNFETKSILSDRPDLTLNLRVFFFCIFLDFGYKITDKPRIPSDNLDPASTVEYLHGVFYWFIRFIHFELTILCVIFLMVQKIAEWGGHKPTCAPHFWKWKGVHPLPLLLRPWYKKSLYSLRSKVIPNVKVVKMQTKR